MPLQKPLLLYDGDCGFCMRWVRRLRRMTGDRVMYAPYQEAGGKFPEIPRAAFEESVQLIEPDGRRSSAAEAVFRVLGHGDIRFPLWLYRHLPGFAAVGEMGYRFTARHRGRGTCRVPGR